MRSRLVLTVIAATHIVAAAIGVSTLLAPGTATAVTQTVPYKINFQGRLTDNSGNVLADGSYNIKFRLFDDPTAGTNRWEGDRVRGASDNRITVQNGLFNIQFGDTSKGDPALSPALFNAATYATLYLEVELPTPATATCATNGCAVFTEGAMTPRQPLASAPYAFNSDTLDGLDADAFGQIATANNFTATNTFSKSGGAGAILSGTPASGGSILQVGSVLSSGHASGTLIGANGSFSGDLINLQVGNATKLKVDNSGNLTLASGAIFAVGASTGSSASCSGGQVLQDQVTVGGITTGGTCGTPAGTGASQSLNNLTTTSINQSLIPNANSTFDLGTASAAWEDLFIETVDTGSTTTTLTVGGTNATAINLGRSALGVTVPATGAVALDLTGSPAASATSSLIQLDAAISGGSASGTYIGANPSSFAGDFANFQVGGAVALKINSFGDHVTGFTQLNGSSTTTGNQNSPGTSMAVTSGTNFDVGNYIQLSSTDCAGSGSGVNVCYAKVTAKATNTLTITPALRWVTSSNVVEYHIPEIGGTDLTSTLTERYGRGYFISGVATGNGTTYYGEDGITTSLTTFDLLTTATTLNIGGASTTVTFAGNLSTSGSAAISSASTVTGTTINGTTGINTGATGGTQRIDASGNLVNIGNLSQTGTYLLQSASDNSSAFQINTNGAARTILKVGTSDTKVTADANLIVNSSVSVPSITSVAAGANSGGTLSGAAGTTYFYKISAIVGSETAASTEMWVNSSAFTPLSTAGLTAPTTAINTNNAGSLTQSQAYTYKVTFVSANGETTASPASSPAVTTTTNRRQIDLTNIPTGPTGTTARKLYRTTGGGSTYLLVNTGSTLNNNSTTLLTDGTADNTLGAAPPSANTATTNLNNVTITFPSFPSASSYRIYRGTSSLGEDHYQTTSSSPFTDTGTAGTAGTPIDATAGRVAIGKTSPGYALDVSGNISASNAFVQSGNVGQSSSCGAGSTFSGLTVSGGIVTATGACASIGGGSASATLQSAYDNSSIPQIALSTGGGGLTVADTAAGLGAALFEVEDNAGTTKYLSVLATGISVTGSGSFSAGVNINSGQTYKINNTQISTSALSDASSITMQGNTFNGASQLVQLNGSTQLPSVSGTNLTNLNPTNLATGTGAVTLTAGSGSNVTLNTGGSGGATVVLGSNVTTLQKAANALTIDLATAATSTLTVTNTDGSNIANLSVEGGITIGSGKAITVGATAGVDRTCTSGDVLTNQTTLGGVVTGGTCAAVSGGSGANTTLSNLGTTSINAALTPDSTANNRDLGTGLQ